MTTVPDTPGPQRPGGGAIGEPAEPYVLYGADVSYFTGKVEAYLRYKEIPYRRVDVTWHTVATHLRRQTGVAKMPVVQTPDGVWLQDSTPMIDWFEERFPAAPVLPDDPVSAFFGRLLEDYADEWLWRPALHYRWSYANDRRLLGARIAAEMMHDMPVPQALRAWAVRRRQYHVYVRGDGVCVATRPHVESVYTATLARLETILRHQPFLLGERPCLADFGFFGSMFRHFSLDPTPSRIMRDTAPAVYEWVARMWNARASRLPAARAAWRKGFPAGWDTILRDIGEAYLPYLHANAVAWRDGRRRFDTVTQGVQYRRLPAVQYRVWCRERLQEHVRRMPEEAQVRARAELERLGCWEPLWRDGLIASRLHEHTSPPVCTPARVRVRRARSPWNP